MKKQPDAPDERDIYTLIEDKGVQPLYFLPSFLETYSIEEFRVAIKKIGFTSLEERTGKSTEELEAAVPGICATFDGFVRTLNDPELTMDALREVIRKASDRSWYKKPFYYVVADAVKESFSGCLLLQEKFPRIEKLRAFIADEDSKPLSAYARRTQKELESALPGISAAFRTLMKKFRNPAITMEEFDEVMDAIKNRTWFKHP